MASHRPRAIALVGILVSSPLFADLVTLEPIRDNTLFENGSGSLSNGSGDYLYVGNIFGDLRRRALMEFDLSSIPAAAVVQSASLRLNISIAGVGGVVRFDAHRLLSDWGEAGSDSGNPGGGGAAAQPGDATWVHTFFNTQTWNDPGGDFAQQISGFAFGDAVGQFTIPSTAGLIADVQGWVNNPSTNFGWLLKSGNEATEGLAKRIDSRENNTSANRPKLTVQYTVPLPPMWNVDGGGSWGNAANWVGGIPDQPGAAANFEGSLVTPANAPAIITLNADRTVGTVKFDSDVHNAPDTRSYVLAPGSGGSLHMNNQGQDASIRVVRGNHFISAAVVAEESLLLDGAPNTELRLLDGLNTPAVPGAAVGQSLTVTGGGIFLVFGGIELPPDATLNVQAGTLATDALRVGRVTVGSGATLQVDGPLIASELNLSDSQGQFLAGLNIGLGKIVIHAADPQGQLTHLTAAIASGRADGEWTGFGINSSSAGNNPSTGVGIMLNDDGAGNPIRNVFAGEAVGINAILIAYTYNGDADLNGMVDADDYFRIDAGFAQGLSGWHDGDFNYSGGVDADDYFLIDSAFASQGTPLGMAVAVPEPGVLTMAGIFVVANATLRRNRKRR